MKKERVTGFLKVKMENLFVIRLGSLLKPFKKKLR